MASQFLVSSQVSCVCVCHGNNRKEQGVLLAIPNIILFLSVVVPKIESHLLLYTLLGGRYSYIYREQE